VADRVTVGLKITPQKSHVQGLALPCSVAKTF